MSEQGKYTINYSGTFEHAQFVAGDHAVLTMHAGAAATSRLSDAELAELRTRLAEIEQQVRDQVPEGSRDAALAQVRELADATVAADQPDVDRLRRIGRWFAANAPDLAGSVAGLLLGPVVGTLVCGAGRMAAALLGDDEPQPG